MEKVWERKQEDKMESDRNGISAVGRETLKKETDKGNI